MLCKNSFSKLTVNFALIFLYVFGVSSKHIQTSFPVLYWLYWGVKLEMTFLTQGRNGCSYEQF